MKKTVIITGSSKGIGLAIAQELAHRDYAVVITSRDPSYAEKVASQITRSGGTCLGLGFNLEQAEAINFLIESTLDSFGRIDVLINNALSQNCAAPLPACEYGLVEAAFTANITNTFALTHAAYPALKNSKGNVINIGSIIIKRHLMGLPLYAIVKGAIEQMTKVLAAEWASDSIRVNAINPGFIKTSAFEDLGMNEDQISMAYDFYKEHHIPLRQIGKPEAVANLAAYLASSEADLITGSSFDIDGGYSIQGRPLFGADQ